MSVYVVRHKAADSYVLAVDDRELAERVTRALNLGLLPSECDAGDGSGDRDSGDHDGDHDSDHGSDGDDYSPGYDRRCRERGREAARAYSFARVTLATAETLAAVERTWPPTNNLIREAEARAQLERDDADQVSSFLEFWRTCDDHVLKKKRWEFTRPAMKRHYARTWSPAVEQWLRENPAADL